jgi:hypothetical protein
MLMSRIRLVSIVSGFYDILLGAAFLVAAPQLARAFGVAPVSPPVLGDIIGLFLLAIGLGYGFPLRDPVRWRGYLWLMGPFLKGGGAVVFLLDLLLRDSPVSFALFALSDGALAVWTLLVLLKPERAAAPRA